MAVFMKVNLGSAELQEEQIDSRSIGPGGVGGVGWVGVGGYSIQGGLNKKI